MGSCHTESTVLTATDRQVALPWIKPGTVCVIPLDRVGTVPEETPLLHHLNEDGDHVQINELAFSPNKANLLATAGNDGSVCVFDVPEAGPTEHVKNAMLSFQASEKRLLGVGFHPLAEGLLITSAADKTVSLYDLSAGTSPLLSLPKVHKGLLTNWSWSPSASLLATHSKDKMLRVFDPRAGDSGLVAEVKDHNSPKSSRVEWMQLHDKIVTAGFNGQERQLAVYDPRQMSERIHTQKLDPSSSQMFLFQDPDTGVLFVAGKGDSSLQYFEITDDAPFLHVLSTYKSNTPQNGLCMLPKSVCQVMKCEIARFLKLSGKRIEPIRFEVPRAQNQFFQEDLFPDTWDHQPTMTASQWAMGDNAPRSLYSLEPHS